MKNKTEVTACVVVNKACNFDFRLTQPRPEYNSPSSSTYKPSDLSQINLLSLVK